MVHETEVDPIAVHLGQATQIAQLVVRRLHQRAHVERRVCEHHDPGLVASLGIDDKVGVLLVIQESDANIAPFLVHPVVESHPILVQVDTQTKLICFDPMLSNNLLRQTFHVGALSFGRCIFHPLGKASEVRGRLIGEVWNGNLL